MDGNDDPASGEGQTPPQDERQQGDRAARRLASLAQRDAGASDRDQGASDRDQTASEADQTASDRDQTAADRDQRASNEDQRASDLETAEGSDQAARDMGTVRREHAASLRVDEGRARLRTSRSRDVVAAERDLAAAERDEVGSGRGRGAIERAQERLENARDEWRAEQDRRQAALDRDNAAEARSAAARNRQLAAEHRAETAKAAEDPDLDELTRAVPRESGLAYLSREIFLARRAPETLIVAIVHVGGLAQINESGGRAEGDGVLLRTADALRAGLRSTDTVIRFAGNEFVCIVPNGEARQAGSGIRRLLAAVEEESQEATFTVGVAELTGSDSATDMIRRAGMDRAQEPPG